MLKKLFKNEAGATVVEYSLLTAAVAIAALFSMDYVGKGVSLRFNQVGQCLRTTDMTHC